MGLPELFRSAKRVGLIVVNPTTWSLYCPSCETGFAPPLPLRRGWRRCPTGCNADKLKN